MGSNPTPSARSASNTVLPAHDARCASPLWGRLESSLAGHELLDRRPRRAGRKSRPSGWASLTLLRVWRSGDEYEELCGKVDALERHLRRPDIISGVDEERPKPKMTATTTIARPPLRGKSMERPPAPSFACFLNESRKGRGRRCLKPMNAHDQVALCTLLSYGVPLVAARTYTTRALSAATLRSEWTIRRGPLPRSQRG